MEMAAEIRQLFVAGLSKEGYNPLAGDSLRDWGVKRAELFSFVSIIHHCRDLKGSTQ